jgi:hypothetical protein
MKPTIAALLALAGASTTLAITPGSSAAITMALTASISAGGFAGETEKTTTKKNAAGDVISETTEYKTIITTVRYGNAQILADLNEQGLLDGTAAGWSIINVDVANDFGSENDTGPVPYAVKKGLAPVRLEFTSAITASAESGTGKLTVDYVKPSYSLTGSNIYKTTITLSIADFNIQGTQITTAKIATGKLGKGASGVDYTFALSAGSKVAAFSGIYSVYDLAEGTLTVAAAKVVDLETLGFAPVTN